MPEISVIIPVYNLEKHLAECLDSVRSQTFPDFEVIAVNDGSSDGSGDILEAYAKEDERIKPLHIANGGVSNARNLGIENANGRYVYFLDGDDTIEPFALDLLYKNIQDADMVQTAYDRVYSDGNVVNEDFTDKVLTEKDIILGSYFLGEIKESSCNKLYRRETIGELRFDTNLKVAEDSVFVHSLIKKSNRIKLMDNITYHYRMHEESCMNSKVKDVHFYPLKLRDDYLKECEGNKALYKKWVSFDVHLCFFLIRLILTNDGADFAHRIPELRKRALKNKRYVFFSRYYNRRFKIGMLLLWLCPPLFYKIYSR